jgi:heme/copper-type cytochrome/quinol oxidase subunit 3
MTAIVVREPGALPPAPEPTRPRTLLVGTMFATVAAGMLFAGILGWYLSLRSDVLASGRPWLPDQSIALTAGGMMMVTLLMSVVTMQWAVFSIARDDRRHGYLALGLTLLLGVAQINQMIFFWLDAKLVATRTPGELMVYVMTVTQIVMAVAGLLFLGFMAFRALAGQFTERHSDGIAAAALFWYAMVAVYAIVWYVVFVTK